MGLADEIAARTAAGLDLVLGVITEVNADNGRVTVNVGGKDFPNMLFATGAYSPHVGDGVGVLRNGSQLMGIGATGVPLPATGIVASVPVGSDTILVTVAGITRSLLFADTYNPVVGDRVYILWPGSSRSGLVISKVGVTAAPPAPPPPGPPPGGASEGVATFVATGVGTYRSGWRNDDNGDVIQGVAPGFAGNNEGAWFYSGQPRATLSGATVTDFQIYLGRTSGGVFGGQSVHLYRVGENDRPAGALSWGAGPHDLSLAVGQQGWFGLPTSLAQDLVNLGGSIGIKGSPYMRMFGLSKSGSAGALRISWRR
jgi:hypothetical protein